MMVKKPLFDLGVSLFAAAFILLACIIKISQDIDIDLNSTNQVVGKVVDKRIVNVREGKQSIKYLRFELNNSDQIFMSRPNLTRYPSLERTIFIGDTLKVYFRPSGGLNTHVYQIEKNNAVLADYYTYNKHTSGYVAVGIFMSLFLVVYAVLRYKKIKIWQLLNKLVQ